IETVPRRGYRFIAPVTAVPALIRDPLRPNADPRTSDHAVIAVHERSSVIFEKTNAWRPQVWVTLLIVVLLVASAYIYRSFRVRPRNSAAAASTPAQAPLPRRALAVLGFRDSSGRLGQAWVSVAFREMLSTELAAGEKLRIVPEENISRSQLELGLNNSD